ncbi:MAG TPA: hypothetical protein VND99_01850 [Candidatus Acidoferrales bacterium]|nr:hypothetical protein [Candidatus Acidoferrales bacterium]
MSKNSFQEGDGSSAPGRQRSIHSEITGLPTGERGVQAGQSSSLTPRVTRSVAVRGLEIGHPNGKNASLHVHERPSDSGPSLTPFPQLASPVPEIPNDFWSRGIARHDLDQGALLTADRIGPYRTDPHDRSRLESDDGRHAVVVGAVTAGGENLAIKVGRSSHPVAHQVFGREAYFHHRAHELSPLVPELLDAGTITLPDVYGGEQAYPILVLRAIDGRNLEQSYHPLPIGDVEQLFMPLAEAVDAFGAEIVHRDLNAYNVLVERGGVARPIDFGLAAPVGTRTDIPLGAPHYRTPEHWERGAEMTTGTNTFQLAKVIEGATDYERAEQPVYARAFADDPAERPTATQFVTDLVAANKQANRTIIY